ncbi:MAG: hypothetical protein K8R36_03105 [Planctomycetales bacterium]|nr:hypothetical protein [Planctomycetales bacterium]
MSNPYSPSTQAGENPTDKRYLPPTRAEDYRPSGNQFTLRGLFIFMTATCVILAILALVIKDPIGWLGVVLVPLVCGMIIVVMEIARLMFPPKPHFHYYLPPVPQNPMQTAYFGEGDSPFAGKKNYFGDNQGNSPFPQPPTKPATNEQPPSETTG